MAVIATPNNTNNYDGIPRYPRAAITFSNSDVDTFETAVNIYVGGTGNVAVRPAGGGAAITFIGLPAGVMVPCEVIGVNSTGTTATSLVAVY